MENWSPNKYLSVKELAQALNISVVTLNKWRCKGGGPPFIRVFSSIRYRWGDVQNWLDERKRSSTAA